MTTAGRRTRPRRQFTAQAEGGIMSERSNTIFNLSGKVA
jgi:hypothetical protein